MTSTPPSRLARVPNHEPRRRRTRFSIRSVPFGSLDREHAPTGDDRRLADIEGRKTGKQIEPDGDREPIVLARRAIAAQVTRDEEIRRELVGADDPVPMILEEPYRASQHLIVPARDEVPHLALVAQERIGAEQSRRARPADRTDQRHRGRLPALESGEDGLEVEEVEGRVGAPADLRLDEAAERQDAVIPPLPLQALDELERELAGAREDRDRTCHQPAPTGSRGVQIARSLPSRMKSRISCTNGCVANSAATSSTRSDSVPSSANRSR